jgi:hypothetical protein
LIGVSLIGVSLICVSLIGVSLIGLSLIGVSPERFSLSSVSNLKVIKGKLSDTDVPFLNLLQLPFSGATTSLTNSVAAVFSN